MKRKTGNEETIAGVIARRKSALATRQGYISLVLRVAVLALVGGLLLTQVFLVTQIKGMGMFPSLKDGDLAIVFRLQQDYQKEDIVAYRAEGVRRFGRIVARPGDVVKMDESGNLTVNGTLQSGEILYPTYASGDLEYPYRVPDDCVFVLGDYRTQTTDSRNTGSVSMDDVEGKVITILRRRGL